MACVASSKVLNCMECTENIPPATGIIRGNFKFCSQECFEKFINSLSDTLALLKTDPKEKKPEPIVKPIVEPIIKPVVEPIIKAAPKRGVQPIDVHYKGYCTWCKHTCTLKWERDGMQFCTRDACTNYNPYNKRPYDPLTFDSAVVYAFPVVCLK